MSQVSLSFELFDKRGALLPIAELEPHVAKLDKNQQKRFAVLKTAALASEAAIESTREAQRQVSTALALVKHREDELGRIRPPVSAIDAARQWINSTR
jgi:hypothetical protein